MVPWRGIWNAPRCTQPHSRSCPDQTNANLNWRQQMDATRQQNSGQQWNSTGPEYHWAVISLLPASQQPQCCKLLAYCFLGIREARSLHREFGGRWWNSSADVYRNSLPGTKGSVGGTWRHLSEYLSHGGGGWCCGLSEGGDGISLVHRRGGELQ